MNLSLRIFVITQLFIGCALCALITPVTWAAPTAEFSKSHAIRVIVRPPGGRAVASSGFLWKRNDLVVTNLHAIPSEENILVVCKDNPQPARVEKVYPEADLALLRVTPGPDLGTADPNDRQKPMDGCVPFTEQDIGSEPIWPENLYTWGWHAGARQITPRGMTRGEGGTLEKLLSENSSALADLQEYGIPETNIELYHVDGGSLPGYSGGFVINDQSKLVAIVDGGLEEGVTGYNWAIPVRYLKLLDESTITQLPDNVIEPPKTLFSTGYADEESNSVRAYQETDANTGSVFTYEWFKTKTRTLGQLASTSIDPDGVLDLVERFTSIAGLHPEELTFDIYQDPDHGLIIATPVDQGLEFEPVPGNPGYKWLKSQAKVEGDGHTQYRQSTWQVRSATPPFDFINPGDPRFFNERISEIVAECNRPGMWSCSVDPASVRIVRFENGNKILRAGFGKKLEGTGFYVYDYYSIAVRENVAFSALVTIEGGPCAEAPERVCANPNATQLAQLVAVQLTTFANLGSTSGGRSLETRFQYDASADHPDTIGVGYFEDNKLRFYNTRGGLWRAFEHRATDFTTTGYYEDSRDQDFVYITNATHSMRIPIWGGEYYGEYTHICGTSDSPAGRTECEPVNDANSQMQSRGNLERR